MICGGGAVLVVLTLWSFSLLPIGADLGQRTNALGALFSGLAFAGLIITLIQQQHELSLQRQELHETRDELRRTAQAQEEQLDVQRTESARQSREQYLIARLNAQAAILQAQATAIELGFTGSGQQREIQRDAAIDSMRMSRIRADILALEAKEGFTSEPWTPSVEKEAIRKYVVGALRWLATESARLQKANSHVAIAEYFKVSERSFEILCDIYRDVYPASEASIKSVIELLMQHEENPGPAIDWCKAAPNNFLKGHTPWV
jgi:hypothetical protein